MSCTLDERISSLATLPFISGMISQQKVFTRSWTLTYTHTQSWHAIVSTTAPTSKQGTSLPNTHIKTHTRPPLTHLKHRHASLPEYLAADVTSTTVNLPITKALPVPASCLFCWSLSGVTSLGTVWHYGTKALENWCLLTQRAVKTAGYYSRYFLELFFSISMASIIWQHLHLDVQNPVFKLSDRHARTKKKRGAMQLGCSSLSAHNAKSLICLASLSLMVPSTSLQGGTDLRNLLRSPCFMYSNTMMRGSPSTHTP